MGLIKKFKSSFKKRVVGLDIGDSTIKLVEIDDSWGEMILKNYSIIEVSKDIVSDGKINNVTKLAEEIRPFLIKEDFKANEVITAISGEEVISRTIEVPYMPLEELDDAVSWEAEDHIPVSIDEVIIDYEILDQIEGEVYELMLIAVKKDLVEKYIKLCKKLDLELKAIEIEPIAIARTINKLYKDDIIGTVDIGEKSTSVSALNNGKLLFTRTIGIGGADITKELMENNNLSYEQAEKYKKDNNLFATDDGLIILDNLITAIYRSFDYFEVKYSNHDLDKIILTGGGSRLKNIINYFAEGFDVPIERLSLGDCLVAENENINAEELDGIGQLLAVSIGLALRKEGE